MKWVRQLPDKPKSLRPIKGKLQAKTPSFHENKNYCKNYQAGSWLKLMLVFVLPAFKYWFTT